LHLACQRVDVAQTQLSGGALPGREAVVPGTVVLAWMVVVPAPRRLQQRRTGLGGRGKRDQLGLELPDPALDLALEV
jgi:hypothetical protein